MATAQSIQNQYVQLFRLLQKHPEFLIHMGAIWLNSPFTVDRNGDVIPNEGGITMYNPYHPTRIQKKIGMFRMLCRQHNRPINYANLKARDVGATIDQSANDVASAVTVSGSKYLTVAHKPGAAESIYNVKREMVKSLPAWLRPDASPRIRDSMEYMEINIPPFGIKKSVLACLPATENIEAARSSRYTGIHFSECAYYDDAPRVTKATGSLLQMVPKDEQWRQTLAYESTANGRDPFFYELVQCAWMDQHEVNFWDPKCRLWFNPTTVLFFPFYMETNKKVLALPSGMKPSDLLDNMDDSEKELYHTKLIPFWEVEQPGEEAFWRHMMAQQLNWRRSKIPSLYPNWPKGGAGIVPVNDLQAFWQEEPSTPEEAFNSREGTAVFGHTILSDVKDTVRDPKRKGLVENGTWVTGCHHVWLWKEPEETSGDLSISIDCGTGNSDPGAAQSFDIDFTHATVWDRVTGEQVAEYVSQEPQYLAAQHIWELCRFYAKQSDRDEDWPFFVFEKQMGTTLLHFILEKDYPRSRIYRHPNPSNRKLKMEHGFHTNSTSKPNAVHAAINLIGQKRRIIRSERVYFQMKFYVWKSDKVAQAENKGKGGAMSKDDGIWTLCMESYAEEHAPRATKTVVGANIPDNPNEFYIQNVPRAVGGDIKPFLDFMRAADKHGYTDPSQLPSDGTLEPGSFRC